LQLTKGFNWLLNFFIFDGVLNGVAKFLKKFEENDIESKIKNKCKALLNCITRN
jgi:hypothetical protein